jgi:hypothetical protein
MTLTTLAQAGGVGPEERGPARELARRSAAAADIDAGRHHWRIRYERQQWRFRYFRENRANP